MSLRVLHGWRSRCTVRHRLFSATAVLATEPVLHRWGMLQPTQPERVLRLASRLAESGLHTWRSRLLSQEPHR